MAQTDKLDERNGRGRSAAIAVAVLVVTFIGVALLKPWGSGERPTASAGAGATQRVSTRTSTTVPGSAAPTVSNAPTTAPPTPSIAQNSATPQISAFTTPLPPPTTAAWTGLRWHLLADDDPLRLVRSVLRWRGGFIALGRDGTLNGDSTPVWISSDGATWTLVPTTDSGPFWPGMLVIGLAEGPTGLVALTELLAENTCDLPACEVYSPPVVSWTSPDGQTWTPNAAVDLGLPDQNTGAPLLAAGPKGLVVVSTDGPYLATSQDGVLWHSATLGVPHLQIAGIVGTATGYTAVGTLTLGSDSIRDAAFQSVDGLRWTGPGTTLPADPGLGVGVTGLQSARNGLIATGLANAAPGAALWWQSSNGRTWHSMPTFGPLGPTTCRGEGCGNYPNGLLASDGTRLMAVRGGQVVWTSFDGDTWRRLAATGDRPASDVAQAVVMPGGVLISSPITSWYGQALP